MKGPVVIGGLGGSGTRVVAHLVRELGFYLGEDLSPSLDNFWFALLLGSRPRWYRANPERTVDALKVFEAAMQGDWGLEPDESPVLYEALQEWRRQARRPLALADWRTRPDGLFMRARLMKSSGGPPVDAAGWGWKNPASHIFLEQLVEVFPRMQYIHVIRNGLELVGKAKMDAQVGSWGRFLGSIRWRVRPMRCRRTRRFVTGFERIGVR